MIVKLPFTAYCGHYIIFKKFLANKDAKLAIE